MSGPTFVRLGADKSYIRAETLNNLNVVQQTVNEQLEWCLVYTGGYAAYPDEASARKALDDILETYGALDLTD